MKITVYNRKQRYTYFEKIIILCLFIRWNKDILLMFQPCLDFYEIWNNKIQQLNDKICYRKEEEKKQKQKLNDKRKFSKVLLRILWGKKANRVIRKLHSMTKYSSNKTKMSNMRKKNLNTLVASIRTTTSSFLLAFTLCKNSRIKHGV